MADDLIKVDIAANYDDKGAKKAKADLEEIDGTKAEAEVTAEDNASKVTGKVDADLTAIDGRKAEAEVAVDDNASQVTGDVEADLEAIDGTTAHATIDVDAGRGLDDVTADLAAVDGSTVKATVDADEGAGLTSVKGDLAAIDGGTYKATVDAGEGSGLSGVKDTLANMATSLGTASTHAGALAGPAGLLAGLGGALLGAAGYAADVALEAQKIANFTGSSVEDAGRLAAVLRDNTSVEANDLLDIIAQMGGVLADNPDLARQFGTSLDEVRQNPLQAFIDIVDQLGADGKLTFDEMVAASKLFGEEGVRQVNDIITAVGPDGLQGAVDDVSEMRIVNDSDVQAARDVKRQFTELTTQLQGMAVTVGQEVVPVLADLLGMAEDVGGALNNVAELGQTGTARSVWDWINEFPSQQFNEIYDALNQAGVSVEELRDNYFHLADVQALLEAGVPTDVIDSANLTAEAQEYLAEQVEATTDAVVGQADAVDDLVPRLEGVVDGIQQHIDKLELEADALRDVAEASDEKADALLEANDVYYAQADASDAAAEAVETYNETMEDSEATTRDQQKALRDVTKSADELARAQVDMARQQRATEGATLSNVEALDLQNESLLIQAANLQGPARQALVDHIARLNNIPPEIVSQILALIDQGKIDEAEQLLGETSRTREAAYTADVDDTSYRNTNKLLDDLANKQRIAKITTQFVQGGGYIPSYITGSGNRSAPPPPPVAVPAGFATAGGDTYNLNVPRGTRPDDMVRALDRHARRNGRPYAFRR